MGRWYGKLLHPADCIISADENPRSKADGGSPRPSRPRPAYLAAQRAEHTYERPEGSPIWWRGTCAAAGRSAARSPRAGSNGATAWSGGL